MRRRSSVVVSLTTFTKVQLVILSAAKDPGSFNSLRMTGTFMQFINAILDVRHDPLADLHFRYVYGGRNETV